MRQHRGWCCWLTLLVLAGCAAPAPPKPPSLDLPKPVGDLRAVRKGNRVYLAWTTPTQTTDQAKANRIGTTRICRSLEGLSDCGAFAGEVSPPEKPPKGSAKPSPTKTEATFADTLPTGLIAKNPTGDINYAVSVLNRWGRSAGLSNQVQVSAAPTLAPPVVAARVTAEGVTLSWNAPSLDNPSLDNRTPQVKFLYRVFRRPANRAQKSPVGDVEWKPNPTLQFTDHNFEWEKTYDYVVTPVTVVSRAGKPDREVEGDDSDAAEVFAHDTFPPAAPAGLQAVYSGAGQAQFIDLIWTPAQEGDLAGYNIYRRAGSGPRLKLNLALAPTPAYRDTIVVSGETYFYAVTAVDVRGNESTISAEASEAAP